MMQSPEYLLSEQPFIIRRTVRWSDCDPAGVVFTGKFTEYLLNAMAMYHDYLGGYSPTSFSKQHGVDTPCKAMSFEFIGTLWPRDMIDLHCGIGEIRNRSYTLHCTARRPDQSLVFKALFSPICVRLDQRIGTPIPLKMRQTLEQQRLIDPSFYKNHEIKNDD